ncbi:hypothetical protein ACJX0J_009226, partial [Zea mays]
VVLDLDETLVSAYESSSLPAIGTGAVLRSPDVAGQRAQGLLRHRRGRCSSRRQQPSWRYLIPILYVSVELVKALQAHIINWDIHMFDEEIGNTTQVCGVDLTDKVVDIIFHVFDANCDGKLSSEEFLRKCLFSMMSDLPSVLEAFADRKHGKDREEKMAMPRVPGQHLLPPRISIYPLKSIFWRTEAIQVE